MSTASLINAMSRLPTSWDTSSLISVAPDPSTSDEQIIPIDFDPSDQERLFDILRKVKPKFHPLEVLPCANVDAMKYKVCSKQGTRACSACKLVSYCSKECQKNHWRIHKHDCKNPLKSSDWKPGWVVENRYPASFFYKPGESLLTHAGEFCRGLSLWGNVPAIDLINLPKNENDASQDLSIALVASGDLRHVMQTINSLPDDYSGHLKILMNDINLPVVARNLTTLLILGTVSDETLAADMALHFWYSVFMPVEYCTKIMVMVASLMLREDPQPLGPHSSMDCSLPLATGQFFRQYGSFTHISMAGARKEYDRVRNAPSRQDLRDRMYARLKPSHRLAFQEFRRSGIVLPFGAMNVHFNTPNTSLFSFDGKWLQTDYTDPLEGWDIGPILEAGRAHGAQPEDIYGCLYFFLSDQLRTFARRLREFRISFHVVTTEAIHLSSIIREGVLSPLGIPASIRFDRIEVSNILDVNYVGIGDVLTHWGPLLKTSPTAALVGYFMNWGFFQPNGDVQSAGHIETKKIIDTLIEKGRFPGIGPGGRISDPRDLQLGFFLVADDMNVAYENSKAFSQFLKGQNLEDILRKTKLKLRKTRTIVPYRYKVPLDAPPNAVPDFADNESWYNYTQLQSFTYMERFVEFGRV
ncbi:hypothetical protein K503DRAFT_20610 [Rhizopogon vinicolor AM-OR11-026]|uniref:MYND-type domain-containing protein n=1 Tax=Rhizopogon vinicolor AM-OR11-026 TaxID=1314800 RepID=A0A1B7MHM3_9AGAM|nr:hypothetical protein K503DRAFT_20610 [Rhizopogon vinicolor AM-OR11-026]